MPTFNQLVRKGRKQVTDKSNSPALQRGLNTLQNKARRNSGWAGVLWRYCLRPHQNTKVASAMKIPGMAKAQLYPQFL